MSIDAVVGRIEQILSMEQQLADPTAVQATAAAPVTSYELPSTTSTGTTPTTFADALANAQAGLSARNTGQSGLGAASAAQTDVSAGTIGQSGLVAGSAAQTGPSLGVEGQSGPSVDGASGGSGLAATSPADPRIQAMVNEADSLLGKPYVYGGGHSGWGPSAGYDCSGFVSAVLHAGGYLSEPADTTSLPDQPGIDPGPGRCVTIYDRALAGDSGHVIIEIDGQFYESGGSAGPWGGGGGVEKIGQPSAAYLADFPNVLHPSGL